MAADVSSVARLLRGEAAAGKRGGAAAAAAGEIVTMDLLGGCGGDAGGGGGGGGGEDEVVDLEVKVPAGWERRLDLMSGKTFLTPRLQGVQVGHQDLNFPPPATSTAVTSTSAAVCTLDMVRSALERATAGRASSAAAAARGATPPTSSSSSATTSSSSSSVGKRHRSPPCAFTAATTATANPPSMRAAACPSCLTYVLIAEADPRCPRCAGNVPPLAGKAAAAVVVVSGDGDGTGKKPKIDLNAAADDETE
uniref:GIR1-like zinc ribbon domain-containing protein n=1 Tax=Leersia perrieri TaxID=77586 RepID=A0A0D9W9I7_9ORYZ